MTTMWWWSDTAHQMRTIIRFLSITCLFIHQQYVHNRYHIIILLRFINNSSLKEDWHPLRCKVFSRFHMVLYLYPQLQYTIEICSRNKGLQFFQLLCDGGEKIHLMDSEVLITQKKLSKRWKTQAHNVSIVSAVFVWRGRMQDWGWADIGCRGCPG